MNKTIIHQIPKKEQNTIRGTHIVHSFGRLFEYKKNMF